MAELAVNNTQSTTGSGLMPGAGSLMAQAKELWNSPAFRRSLPTIVAVVVTLMGLLGLFCYAATLTNHPICFPA